MACHILKSLFADRQVGSLQLRPQVWVSPGVAVVALVVPEVELVNHRAHLQQHHTSSNIHSSDSC